ncbi:hypothetical protein HJG60_010632 [Phyllostomus discolor]|uniref:Uncharacterized protein n=1 Tax=Phyllostomus discolor TaxID=89673 RepID=A0A834EF31_9CHIR|nr:hypothetical protein HJG60_010632 [Phyllostomus discolor]
MHILYLNYFKEILGGTYENTTFVVVVVVQVRLSPFSIPPLLPPTPTIPTSHPQSYPLWLCPSVLYTCSLTTLPPFPSFTPSHLPSDYCQFVLNFIVSLVIFCLLVLLIRFHLQVRSYVEIPLFKMKND